MLQSAWSWIEKNRGIAVAMVLCVCLTVWVVGCAPSIQSPFSGQPVTRSELDNEIISVQSEFQKRSDALAADIAAANSKIESAYAEMERVEAVRAALITMGTQTLQAVEAGTLPTNAAGAAGYMLGMLGLLGIGAGVDNVRKRTVISVLKSKSKK